MRGSGIRPQSLGRRAILTLSLITFAGAAAVGQGSAPAQDPPPAAPPELELVGTFERPYFVTRAPGASSAGLLFVVEGGGTVRIVDHGAVLPEPFLDIQALIEDSGPQGLLSIAFPPDYETSRLFYVFFTNNAGNIEVDEFRASPGDPTDADESTRRRVLAISHPVNPNHNGGQLQFGPDGMLWISTGDGGGPGDPGENAEDISSPLGKMLRIDPRVSGANPYSVPADNPLVGVPGRDEIWSRGLRNPWRFSFDGPRIVIGDVGAASWEEVSYETIAGARGANFGWDNYEGTHLFEGPELTVHEPPIHEYSSALGGANCSITGGYVSRDRTLPDLFGRYVYADFCAGELRSLIPRLGGASDDAPLGLTVASPTSFGVGPGKRLYVASVTGPVYRLVPGSP